MRRPFLIFAIIIVLLGIGAGAYFYFKGRSTNIVVTPTNPTLPGSTTATPIETTPTTTTVSGTPARFMQVSKGPIVQGLVAVAVPPRNASSTADVAVRFIERQSGNVYQYLAKAGTLTRTSNRTVPGIQSAAWLPSGASAFVRYLSGPDFSTINTFALSATGEQGFFLPQNLADVSVASTSILTLTSGVNGSVGSLTRPDGSNARQVFTTPLSQVRAHLAGSQYLLVTKASGTLPGSAYIASGGASTRVAGPHLGLVALPSPTGKWVLVSYIENETMQMELINTQTFERVAMPVATIADKCTWTARDEAVFCGIPMDPPAGRYPDDWYQGVTSFSDRIWKIDVQGRFAQLVLDLPKEDKGIFDISSITVDASLDILSFLNKLDESLWVYSL